MAHGSCDLRFAYFPQLWAHTHTSTAGHVLTVEKSGDLPNELSTYFWDIGPKFSGPGFLKSGPPWPLVCASGVCV